MSGSKFRVQDRFFSASSEASSNPASGARLAGASWCSQEPYQRKQPFLQIRFGAAVNISVLRISGYRSRSVVKFRVLTNRGSSSVLHAVYSKPYSVVCMRVCVYACMRVCVYACMRVCVYACMRVCVYACMRVCVYACMRVCVYVYMYVCMHVCMHACMYVYLCMCVCMYLASERSERDSIRGG